MLGGIYKIKKKHIIISWLVFGGLTVYYLVSFILSTKILFAFLCLISTALLSLFVLLSKTAIITTDKVIKKTDITGVEECTWDMIYSITTNRTTSTGNYSTYISWAIDPQYRNRIRGIFEKNPKSGTINVSDHYEGYMDLLKEIKAKAVNAKIDETTEKLMVSRNG